MRSSASIVTSSGIVIMIVHTFLWLWDMTGMSPLYSSISVTVCWAQGQAVIPVTFTPIFFVSGPSRTICPPASNVNISNVSLPRGVLELRKYSDEMLTSAVMAYS